MEQQQHQQQPQGGDAAMHDVSVQGVPGAPDDSNPGTVPVPAPVPIQQEDDLVMEQPVAEAPVILGLGLFQQIGIAAL